MNRIRNLWLTWVACTLCVCLCGACDDEEDDGAEPYPSLITEFVDIYTDGEGYGYLLVTDKGNIYAINQPLQGLRPTSAYRVIGGYVLTDRTDGQYQVVELRTAESITLLKAVEDTSEGDAPVQVTSIWRGGHYLNFHLAPKTQGGQHTWGYRIDGVRETETGYTYNLSLYHRQPDDPYSYSTTVYASLVLDDIGELQQGDSITFTILTFNGNKTWKFAY